MNKKLTVRTQKLIKPLPTLSKSFAASVTIEPDELDLIEKRGVIYSIFDLTTSSEVDPLLVTKIVHDVLFDSYYGAETVSPIQSLERAIVNVRDKVTQLSETKSDIEFSPSFNMLAAVLWGNVLYMVQFGKGGSYLVRENVVKPVNSATEGSFSVASGIVKDDDVIILGTKAFLDKYTAQDLISDSVSFSMHSLVDTAAAFLLKFDMVSELTEAEKIDFNLGYVEAKVPAEPVGATAKKQVLGDLPRVVLPKISLTRVKISKFSWYYMGVAVLVLGLGLSLFFSVKAKNDSKMNQENSSENTEKVSPESKNAAQPSAEELAAKQKEDDEKNKVSRVEAKFFYDLKLVEESVAPTDIAILDTQVAVSDKTSGKLFFSSTTTPKFEFGIQSAGVSNLHYFGGDLSFTDAEGYKIYDFAKKEITEKYTGSVQGPSAPYLAFLYGIKDSTIQKYQLLDSGISGKDWATSETFVGATSLAIDGNIYVLKSDALMKYFSGAKADFSLDSLDKNLNNAVKVVKDVDLDNLYVADAGNKRVLVLDEKGSLIKQIMSKGNEFDDIKSISVSRDEKMLYVLSGSKVYEVTL